MNKSLALTAVAATLLLAMFAGPMSAAEGPVEKTSTPAPSDPDAILRKIELAVLTKQYEKVLTAAHEADLERRLGPNNSDQTSDQTKQWKERLERKCNILTEVAADIRNRIQILSHQQYRIESDKREEEKRDAEAAKIKPAASAPKEEPGR